MLQWASPREGKIKVTLPSVQALWPSGSQFSFARRHQLVLKGPHYSVEILCGQEIFYLQFVRALHATPDESFVWLLIHECFLLRDDFKLGSDHFINISIHRWVHYQPEVLLLSKWQGFTISVFCQGTILSGECWRGGRADSNHSFVFLKLFLGQSAMFVFVVLSYCVCFGSHERGAYILGVPLKDSVPGCTPRAGGRGLSPLVPPPGHGGSCQGPQFGFLHAFLNELLTSLLCFLRERETLPSTASSLPDGHIGWGEPPLPSVIQCIVSSGVQSSLQKMRRWEKRLIFLNYPQDTSFLLKEQRAVAERRPVGDFSIEAARPSTFPLMEPSSSYYFNSPE